MFNFVFDKKSLTLLLAGLTVAGGLLFFAGLLVGVNLGLPGLHHGVAYAPRPLPASTVQPAKPCPEPMPPVEARPAEKPAPAPEPEPEPVQAPPQIAETPAPEPAPTAAPVEKPERPRVVQAALRSQPSGAFSVQVGAFSLKENSDAVMHELESHGYQPYVVVLPGRRARLHTVRIGRYADRQEAQQAAAELRQRANMAGIVQRIGRL